MKKILIIAIAAVSAIAVTGFAAKASLTEKARIARADAATGIRTYQAPTGRPNQTQAVRFLAAPQSAPLVVDLHQWSTDQAGTSGKDADRLDLAAKARGWNYVRPALAGPNNHPGACCSRAVIDALAAAIDYAKANGRVDASRIYVVGASGGGYTGLCALMSGRFQVRKYLIWVPVTDLVEWKATLGEARYGRDILQCTASGATLNVAEARKRSPLYMPSPARLKTEQVRLYAGIKDGHQGPIPIAHSIRFYNRLASEVGGAPVSADDAFDMMRGEAGPQTLERRTIGGRTIHDQRTAGPYSLTVFEGGHELLTPAVIEEIEADDRPTLIASAAPLH